LAITEYLDPSNGGTAHNQVTDRDVDDFTDIDEHPVLPNVTAEDPRTKAPVVLTLTVTTVDAYPDVMSVVTVGVADLHIIRKDPYTLLTVPPTDTDTDETTRLCVVHFVPRTDMIEGVRNVKFVFEQYTNWLTLNGYDTPANDIDTEFIAQTGEKPLPIT